MTAKTAGLTIGESVAERIERFDWAQLRQNLTGQGNAVLQGLLSADEARGLAKLYPDDGIFRSRVIMARHGFGRGEYKYFDYPLPQLVSELRTAFYPPLAEVANRWNERMGIGKQFPQNHAEYLDLCHKAGQTKATPLLLQYGAGDYNC